MSHKKHHIFYKQFTSYLAIVTLREVTIQYNTEPLIFKMGASRFLDVFKEETSEMKENAVALIIT